jgi:hypothetical protein
MMTSVPEACCMPQGRQSDRPGRAAFFDHRAARNSAIIAVLTLAERWTKGPDWSEKILRIATARPPKGRGFWVLADRRLARFDAEITLRQQAFS